MSETAQTRITAWQPLDRKGMAARVAEDIPEG